VSNSVVAVTGFSIEDKRFTVVSFSDSIFNASKLYSV